MIEVVTLANFFGLVILAIFVLAKHFSTHQVIIAPTDQLKDKPATDLPDSSYDVDKALEDYLGDKTGSVPDLNGILNEMEIVKK